MRPQTTASTGAEETVSALQPSRGGEEADDIERGDEVPVLSCENGVWGGLQEPKVKRTQYVRPRLISRRLPAKCREAGVLATGVLLTCVALGLIVAGAMRLRECRNVKLVRLKHPVGKTGYEDFGDSMFSFDQLVMLNNFAFQRPAMQSSTDTTTRFLPEIDGRAEMAVDGSTETCSRTDLERTPRWQVDLGRLEPIRSIRILGSNITKLLDFEVFVGPNSDITSNRVCYRHLNRSSSNDIRVTCHEQLSGSHIGIVLHTGSGNNFQSLVLCEVMVFGR